MLTEEELRVIGHTLIKPELFSSWRHKKTGNIYEVYDITNEQSQKTSKIITISYKRLNDQSKWSRFITDWYDDFEPYLERAEI